MSRTCTLGRVLVGVFLTTLCAGGALAQSLPTIANKGYEGRPGPWITKYVSAAPGTVAPELIVKRWLNRQPTTLRDLRNHTVLIYFWATWCAACPEGLAKLQRLAREAHAPVEILTVRLPDQVGSTPISDDRNTPTTLPVAVDGGATARIYGIKAVPACVIVDRNGFIRFAHIRLPTPAEIDTASGSLPRNMAR